MEGNGHKKTRNSLFICYCGSLLVLNEPVFGAAAGLVVCWYTLVYYVIFFVVVLSVLPIVLLTVIVTSNYCLREGGYIRSKSK